MFKLAPLPFSKDSLQPAISKETLEYHHDKHHQAYIDHLNKLIDGTEFEKLSLEEIIKKSTGSIFDNSAQAWNHDFYWKGITPEKLHGPKDKLLHAIEKNFGNIVEFEQKFQKAASDLFGSGWVWLVKYGADLRLETTGNAENPLKSGGVPLLTCDVWEHAYYIDYRNSRDKYVSQFWKIINWEFAETNYTKS